MSNETNNQTKPDHLLPAPQNATDSDAVKLDVNSDEGIKFDALGPMIINSDGTISRIANWDNMTDAEKERTMRVLNTRNQVRLKRQREAQGIPESS